jgi:hypothetical protein
MWVNLDRTGLSARRPVYPPTATELRTSRIGSFVPIGDIAVKPEISGSEVSRSQLRAKVRSGRRQSREVWQVGGKRSMLCTTPRRQVCRLKSQRILNRRVLFLSP